MSDRDALLQIQAITNAALGAPATTPTVDKPPATGGGTPPPVATGPIQPSATKNYPGPDRYAVYPRRLDTGDLQDGQQVSGGFTIPPGVTKTLELPQSGAYLHPYVNGTEYTGPFQVVTGHYLVEYRAQGHSANGSLDFNFS